LFFFFSFFFPFFFFFQEHHKMALPPADGELDLMPEPERWDEIWRNERRDQSEDVEEPFEDELLKESLAEVVGIRIDPNIIAIMSRAITTTNTKCGCAAYAIAVRSNVCAEDGL
jgi:hypothetical protein